MLRKLICLIMLICLYGQTAVANDVIQQQIPNAQIVGQGRLSVLFWEVYDTKLYAPNGKWSYDVPFALSIRYLRHIKGADIADRSVHEMRGQGFKNEPVLAAWHNQMKAIFPDVENGTVLSAVFIPGQHAEFFKDNNPIGSIKGDEFIRWFSGIWLSEKTSEPALRQKLLANP